LYGIPLRCLYSRSVANLFLAGRDISVSHVAHGSTRVMKTCAAIGEASGTAAALAVQQELTPRALATSTRLVGTLQQTLLRNGSYLPLVKSQDPADLTRLPGVLVTATSEARFQLDDDEQANPSGWEHAGMSTLESRFAEAGGAKRSLPAEVAATVTLAQAIVLSASYLDVLILRLHSSAKEPRPVTLYLRQASHLRDFGPCKCRDDEIATLEALVEPGESMVAFRAARPIAVEPGRPIIVVLPPTPDLTWCLSSQEPPGTQAARWDEELGYWRWLHGTLYIVVDPISTPYGPANVLSGVTRPEVGANLWISDPAQPFPQTLQIVWPEPVTVGRVELTFDSSLSGWIWEGTFPSIVRDYRIEVGQRAEGPWEVVTEIEGNYQRRRVHQFPARRGRMLRISVIATNGMKTARIFEVRAYGPSGHHIS
ncbi:MAG TPA: FAD-dependent oxidoreductase, partial [Chloroflexota bacterium]|nr:FAD-dependent oxidoreductase [Chloroflexota bacterium]